MVGRGGNQPHPPSPRERNDQRIRYNIETLLPLLRVWVEARLRKWTSIHQTDRSHAKTNTKINFGRYQLDRFFTRIAQSCARLLARLFSQPLKPPNSIISQLNCRLGVDNAFLPRRGQRWASPNVPMDFCPPDYLRGYDGLLLIIPILRVRRCA